MIKKLLIMLLLSATAAAGAADWEWINAHPAGSGGVRTEYVAIDRASIMSKSGVVRFWTWHLPPAGATIDGAVGKKILQAIDCNNMTVMFLSSVSDYADGRTKTASGSGTADYIVPGTFGEGLYKSVCQPSKNKQPTRRAETQL